MGEQYLFALIKCAAWIPNAYKVLADMNKTHSGILRELYLCACDSVPAERAVDALEMEEPEKSLHLLRRKQIMEEAMGDPQAPDFGFLFPEEGQPQAEEMGATRNAQEEETAKGHRNEGILPKENPDSGIKSIWRRILPKKTKQTSIPDFVEQLLDEGYCMEQVDYLLTCIEEGVNPQDIKEFASPKLPVDVMKRLRKMKERKLYGQ